MEFDMSFIMEVQKGRTEKRVLLTPETGETLDNMLDEAIQAANETRSSLFGFSMTHYDGGTTRVTLYTD
jgi:hypothetical protein